MVVYIDADKITRSHTKCAVATAPTTSPAASKPATSQQAIDGKQKKTRGPSTHCLSTSACLGGNVAVGGVDHGPSSPIGKRYALCCTVQRAIIPRYRVLVHGRGTGRQDWRDTLREQPIHILLIGLVASFIGLEMGVPRASRMPSDVSWSGESPTLSPHFLSAYGKKNISDLIDFLLFLLFCFFCFSILQHANMVPRNMQRRRHCPTARSETAPVAEGGVALRKYNPSDRIAPMSWTYY
jgi:hypothetical protein